MPFQTQAQQAAQLMMRGNTNDFSAAKRSNFNNAFNSGEKSQTNNGRKVFTAGNNNKSSGALPPTHPKGFGATSTI